METCEVRLEKALAEVERLRHANANFHDARRELAAMKEQRDRYALAMAHALREGIFAHKAKVSAEIERLLKGEK